MKLISAIFFIFISTLLMASEKTIVVFAASSLTGFMQEAVLEYKKENKSDIKVSYAASGALARQISSGAPAGIFISANKDWVDYLVKKDLLDRNSITDFVGNRIVLVTHSSGLKEFAGLSWDDLLKKLEGRKIAIGDPAYVPAGTYARQAMETLGIWGKVKGNLVYADNARVALTMVTRGEATLGVVFASDLYGLNSKLSIVKEFDNSTYQPALYQLAVVKGSSSEVYVFYKYLMSNKINPLVSKYLFQIVHR